MNPPIEPKIPIISPAVANPFPPWLGFFFIWPSAIAEKTMPAGVPQQTKEVMKPTIARVFVVDWTGWIGLLKFCCATDWMFCWGVQVFCVGVTGDGLEFEMFAPHDGQNFRFKVAWFTEHSMKENYISLLWNTSVLAINSYGCWLITLNSIV